MRSLWRWFGAPKNWPASNRRKSLSGKGRAEGIRTPDQGIMSHAATPEIPGENGTSHVDASKSPAVIAELATELQAIVTAWPNLPDAIKSAILVLVQAASAAPEPRRDRPRQAANYVKRDGPYVCNKIAKPGLHGPRGRLVPQLHGLGCCLPPGRRAPRLQSPSTVPGQLPTDAGGQAATSDRLPPRLSDQDRQGAGREPVDDLP